jgi:AraC family transcriptional regulator of adaptative response / DNA-3-methyladenine glycosylase II
MELTSAACYRAFASRDRRFEGRFVIAVTTTRIYCRPGCPARLPRRENVSFFACAAAAEEAGFRPCMRCRPETTPGSPAWLGTSATVERALRLIESGALDESGVDALAARLGIGERHLRRLFVSHLGVAPQRIAHTRRVHFARRLLDQTVLPIAEVALASGFASLRRFHSAMRGTFRMTPREMRAIARGAKPARRARPRALILRLAFRPPLDWAGLTRWLGDRACLGVERVSAESYRRAIRLESGEAAAFEIRPAAGASSVELELTHVPSAEVARVVGRVSRMFDLASDPARIAAHLKRDPLLARALEGRRGVRMPGAWDPFELAVRAILGQQVSVAAATTLAGRLVAAHGDPISIPGREDVARLFPTPERLSRADLTRIGVTKARAHAIRSLAAAVRDRSFDFASFRDLEDALARLEALTGFGEWTANYVAMRGLGEPDAFPAGDLGVRRALKRGPDLPSVRDVIERAEAWRPWRAYAAMALWTDPRHAMMRERRDHERSVTPPARRETRAGAR